MAKWIEDPQGREEVEKVTEELKLPIWKPNYKGKFREFWHELWEKIEDNFIKLKKSNEGKEPAFDKNTAFNKNLGTEEGTVLEGNKFNQMIGKEFGGLLNIPGQKVMGKAYFDNNTKKLYICKNDNTDISANVNNYIPFDNNSLLDRLENLFASGTCYADNSSNQNGTILQFDKPIKSAIGIHQGASVYPVIISSQKSNLTAGKVIFKSSHTDNILINYVIFFDN